METAVRIVLIVIAGLSFLLLLNRFRVGRKTWNTKTRDYWYALTMWSFASTCGTTESLIRHLPIRYSIALSIAAAFTTLSGVLRKGTWGSADESRQ